MAESFLKKNQVGLVILVVVIGFFIYQMYYKESFEDVLAEDQKLQEAVAQEPQPQPPVAQEPQPQLPVLQEPEQPVPQVQAEQLIQEKPQLTSDELLPKYDEANEFAKQNPVSDLLKEQNFLISGYHMGINTVMQSNKIPFHDLRSAPPIPKQNIGPFLQSSYETPAGTNRRSLEIL